MKKFVCAAMAAALLLTSCVVGNTGYTPSPDSSATPGTATSEPTPPVTGSPDGYEDVSTTTLYFPEGTDEDTAQYRLAYSVPAFGDGDPVASAMSAAVQRYCDSLLRTAQERALSADRAEGEALPYTEVTCELREARGYTSVVFHESHSYGASVERSVSTLVLDSAGIERPLPYVCGSYDAQRAIAQRILSEITTDADGFYFRDVDEAGVLRALDLFNGYTVEEFGFRIYIAPATIAPQARGILIFDLAAEELAPEFVGEIMSFDDYSRLLPELNHLAVALAENYESFSDSAISARAATVYACHRAVAQNPTATGAISLSQDEFDALMLAVFATAPAIDQSTWPMTESDDGYAISAGYSLPDYGVNITGATAQGDSILLTGTLQFGAAGSATGASVAAAVEIAVRPHSGSPFGFRIEAFRII
ncbi:MAG: hypothetical protein Q4B99_03630 [Clostridia bacterium]|nr:hypothetical protein [Clostridia bacterium]